MVEVRSGSSSAFEEARQANLEEKDEAVRQTALGYGDPGEDNGVIITFGNLGKGVGGSLVADISYDSAAGKFLFHATATFSTDLSGDELRAAAGHEGQHLLDAQSFFATLDHQTGSFDSSKNLTIEQTERNAYLISHRILSIAGSNIKYAARGGPVKLGTGVVQKLAERRIEDILKGPHYAHKLTERQIARYAP